MHDKRVGMHKGQVSGWRQSFSKWHDKRFSFSQIDLISGTERETNDWASVLSSKNSTIFFSIFIRTISVLIQQFE